MPRRRSDQAAPYRATIARAGRWYEAWTDSLPFVYGRPSETAQGALDSLDEAWRRAIEGEWHAS